MVKENADFLGHLRAEGVLDLEGVIVHHVLVDSKRFAEQTLRKAMTAQHVPGARFALR